MAMKRDDYLALMKFPKEWIEMGMFPDELWDTARQYYQSGHGQSPEHDRNGAFHWWLKRSPSRDVLQKLVELSFLDPDQLMAADVRSYIGKSENADSMIRAKIGTSSPHTA